MIESLCTLHETLLGEFETTLDVTLDEPPEYRTAMEDLYRYLETQALRPPTVRRRRLIAHINRKFDLNREPLARLYAKAAAANVVFSFLEKRRIQDAFDGRDKRAFLSVLQERELRPSTLEELGSLFHPVSEAETVVAFQQELRSPSRLRRPKADRPIDREIMLAAFSAFAFEAAEPQILHAYFDEEYTASSYEDSYWLQLRAYHPELYSRERTLDVMHLAGSVERSKSYAELRRRVLAAVAASYDSLVNHGHLAVILDSQGIGHRNVTWELASDVMLFAEKHVEIRLEAGYFNPDKIAHDTSKAIPTLNHSKAAFEIANEGFTYRDTFVLADPADRCGEERLLLLFQKNERDETVIPCPACRSRNVRGNSYPSLGVKSWECQNPLCPDRSKYNRGKRYSFKALLSQEAISSDGNQISEASVRQWARDVQPKHRLSDILEMLIRHYSLAGDGIHLFGMDEPQLNHGRQVVVHGAMPVPASVDVDGFYDSAWFHRYCSTPCESAEVGDAPVISVGDDVELLLGDSAEVLIGVRDDSLAGAVTSPPYYNAREYAQWPNIYAYLHDMQLVAREVFRCLEPGGVFLYNIFDYFDNERTLAFSAMGDKRLVLSAYTVDAFRRIGFVTLGNITWDKGSIEGKRGFNSGNFSPYYQAPFNCWEHVLVFGKPPTSDAAVALSRVRAVLNAKPVMKMVRGANVHGHSAPFPKAVPALLAEFARLGGRVLDPYAGSGTTALALASKGYNVLLVERDEEYFELMHKRTSEMSRQVELALK